MMKKLKIVYMGTPEFAVAPLAALLKDERFEIVAVVSQPDKAQGRRMTIQETPVKQLARAYGLSILQPTKMKDGTLAAALSGMEVDFLLTCAYGRILPKEILAIPKIEALNLHASLLPKYRGAAPIQWALLNGDQVTGVSLMRMDEELDHGAIFAQEQLPIAKDDNYESLSAKLSVLAAAMATRYLPEIANGQLKGEEQAHDEASFTKILSREDGRINWENEAEQISNLIRATYPWPGSFTFLNGKRLKIFSALVPSPNVSEIEHLQTCSDVMSGTILKDKKHLFVVCGKEKKSLLQLTEVQAEGGKRLAAREFMQRLRGNEVLGADG